MRGRLPAGPEYVEKLQGPQDAKRRLEIILRTLAGTCRVQEACAELGVSEARFHQLRQEALQAALDGLTPRPAGRPAAPPADVRVAELEQQKEALRLELLAAQTREEIALVLPRLAQAAGAGQGDDPGKKARRRRQEGRRP
jgi:Helix-turn-helix domain